MTPGDTMRLFVRGVLYDHGLPHSMPITETASVVTKPSRKFEDWYSHMTLHCAE